MIEAFVVEVGAGHVDQFGGLVLDGLHDFGMTVAGGVDGDAGGEVEELVAVDVFDAAAAAAFGDQRIAAGVGGRHPAIVGVDDGARFGSGQRAGDARRVSGSFNGSLGETLSGHGGKLLLLEMWRICVGGTAPGRVRDRVSGERKLEWRELVSREETRSCRRGQHLRGGHPPADRYELESVPHLLWLSPREHSTARGLAVRGERAGAGVRVRFLRSLTLDYGGDSIQVSVGRGTSSMLI